MINRVIYTFEELETLKKWGYTPVCEWIAKGKDGSKIVLLTSEKWLYFRSHVQNDFENLVTRFDSLSDLLNSGMVKVSSDAVVRA